MSSHQGRPTASLGGLKMCSGSLTWGSIDSITALPRDSLLKKSSMVAGTNFVPNGLYPANLVCQYSFPENVSSGKPEEGSKHHLTSAGYSFLSCCRYTHCAVTSFMFRV